jgi:secondary thiamine-phosphate synthase enzyme
MMLDRRYLNTRKPGLYEITDEVKDSVAKSGIKEGLCVVYCPHPDAGILITSFWDPLGHEDIMDDLDRIMPSKINYRFKGDPAKASAHSKSAIAGVSLDLMISDGELKLGSSQGIFFAEYLEKAEREYLIKCIG